MEYSADLFCGSWSNDWDIFTNERRFGQASLRACPNAANFSKKSSLVTTMTSKQRITPPQLTFAPSSGQSRKCCHIKITPAIACCVLCTSTSSTRRSMNSKSSLLTGIVRMVRGWEMGEMVDDGRDGLLINSYICYEFWTTLHNWKYRRVQYYTGDIPQSKTDICAVCTVYVQMCPEWLFTGPFLPLSKGIVEKLCQCMKPL